MKCFLSIACLITGLMLGSVGGYFCGAYVQLQKQFNYQNSLMAAMADDVHPEKRHR